MTLHPIVPLSQEGSKNITIIFTIIYFHEDHAMRKPPISPTNTTANSGNFILLIML